MCSLKKDLELRFLDAILPLDLEVCHLRLTNDAGSWCPAHSYRDDCPHRKDNVQFDDDYVGCSYWCDYRKL